MVSTYKLCYKLLEEAGLNRSYKNNDRDSPNLHYYFDNVWWIELCIIGYDELNIEIHSKHPKMTFEDERWTVFVDFMLDNNYKIAFCSRNPFDKKEEANWISARFSLADPHLVEKIRMIANLTISFARDIYDNADSATIKANLGRVEHEVQKQ
jgi:hypothetical protein